MNVIRIKDEYQRIKVKVDHVGKLKMSFVNIDKIVEGEEDVIEALKENIDDDLFRDYLNRKYTHNLFYMAPLYHKKFSNLQKMIVLDIDLIFQSSIQNLWTQLEMMDRCIGVGPDLSPHYWHRLRTFRTDHPDTLLGSPGQYQGYNTGVVLFNLHCMRNSQFQSLWLLPDKVERHK